MMKKLAGRLVAALGVAALGVAAPAHAAVFTVDDYAVSLNASDPGLVVWASDLMPDDYSFELNGIGETHTAALFQIGTNETTVNLDDWVQYPINVDFSFSSPPPPFGGTSVGVTGGIIVPFTSCGILAGGCGYAQWDNPALLSFGQLGDGLLAISLSDVIFGTPGSATVTAKFTLLNAATASVPEPTSLLLFGLGLMGAALHVRRRFPATR